MKYRKFVAIATLSVMLGGVGATLLADSADARAGRRGGSFGGSSSYKSMGDRGNRTVEQGQQNRMQGITQTRQNAAKPAAAAGAAGQKQSWFQRNPLMAGLVGALAGTAIGAMLFNMLGGMGGLGGMMGILGLLLLAGLAFMAFRAFRAKSQPQPQFSGMGATGSVTPFQRPATATAYSGGATATAEPYRQSKEQGLAAIALANPSFRTEAAIDELTGLFFKVQEAWSANDKAGIQALATDEMTAYFAEDLDLMVMKGERNVIKNIVIRQFEVEEAWQEEASEYITARIQARLIDYVERNGQVVEGDPNQPTDFAEFWTFKRSRGGHPHGGEAWKLSAINQMS